jgi:putative flippase GtrA
MQSDPRDTRLDDGSWSAPGAVALARRIGAGTKRAANWVQLVKFGLVGASGYVINLAVFAALSQDLGLHYSLAAVGAFCVAVSNNYLWNRYWTFGSGSGQVGFQAIRFFAVSVAALGVNLVALQLLVSAGVPALEAQALAVAIAMPFNFIGNKLWTFG